MTSRRRVLIALALMSIGLVALLIDSVDQGWTTLGGVGVACLAVAIGAQVVMLRQHQAS